MGLLKELDKFDNLYFGINHKSCHDLDPQARILMEVVYESIADAGIKFLFCNAVLTKLL